MTFVKNSIEKFNEFIDSMNLTDDKKEDLVNKYTELDKLSQLMIDKYVDECVLKNHYEYDGLLNELNYYIENAKYEEDFSNFLAKINLTDEQKYDCWGSYRIIRDGDYINNFESYINDCISNKHYDADELLQVMEDLKTATIEDNNFGILLDNMDLTDEQKDECWNKFMNICSAGESYSKEVNKYVDKCIKSNRYEYGELMGILKFSDFIETSHNFNILLDNMDIDSDIREVYQEQLSSIYKTDEAQFNDFSQYINECLSTKHYDSDELKNKLYNELHNEKGKIRKLFDKINKRLRRSKDAQLKDVSIDEVNKLEKGRFATFFANVAYDQRLLRINKYIRQNEELRDDQVVKSSVEQMGKEDNKQSLIKKLYKYIKKNPKDACKADNFLNKCSELLKVKNNTNPLDDDEAKRKAEDAKKKAEEDAKKKADYSAKRKAEEDAKKKAEEDAKKKAEEDAKRKAEEDAKKKAEEDAKKKADYSNNNYQIEKSQKLQKAYDRCNDLEDKLNEKNSELEYLKKEYAVLLKDIYGENFNNLNVEEKQAKTLLASKEKLELLRQKLEEMKQLQKEIDSLSSKIASYYIYYGNIEKEAQQDRINAYNALLFEEEEQRRRQEKIADSECLFNNFSDEELQTICKYSKYLKQL